MKIEMIDKDCLRISLQTICFPACPG